MHRQYRLHVLVFFSSARIKWSKTLFADARALQQRQKLDWISGVTVVSVVQISVESRIQPRMEGKTGFVVSRVHWTPVASRRAASDSALIYALGETALSGALKLARRFQTRVYKRASSLDFASWAIMAMIKIKLRAARAINGAKLRVAIAHTSGIYDGSSDWVGFCFLSGHLWNRLVIDSFVLDPVWGDAIGRGYCNRFLLECLYQQ